MDQYGIPFNETIAREHEIYKYTILNSLKTDACGKWERIIIFVWPYLYTLEQANDKQVGVDENDSTLGQWNGHYILLNPT